VKYYALFSGGKDSSALAHYLKKRRELKACVFLDTGINDPQLLEWLRTLPYHVIVYETPVKFDWIVRRYGFARPMTHNWYYRFLKERALNLFVKDHREEFNEGVALASGVRRNESKRRFKNTKSLDKICGVDCYAPIFDWTTEQVREYIKINSIEISPSAKFFGCCSGDCFCGAFAEEGELDLVEARCPEVAKRIRALERQVGAKWGSRNLPRMSQDWKDRKEQLGCSDCTVRFG
jgi:3'-phosphoadenosine 5'-phosphosulfate sulfotransferase (PAPS reductase)/FAD synthetase